MVRDDEASPKGAKMSTYPEEFKALEEENKRLREALKVAQGRFTNPDFGINWKDAADDIKRALKK